MAPPVPAAPSAWAGQPAPAGAAGSSGSASAAPSPGPTGGSAHDLAFTGSNDLLPLTGVGLLAIGGGVPALRTRAQRKGAHRG
ncbi:hypothetical protein [Kitasatospora mediocidica]|uniref:hypothetical protein n=1 Tax=Kitasatospora mediocidica TaxID=58352 RepID=UPI00055DB551|nr:hypothetical protein [Kitasatospora mediocidica]